MGDGILDNGLIHAADFHTVLARADVQAGTETNNAGKFFYIRKLHALSSWVGVSP